MCPCFGYLIDRTSHLDHVQVLANGGAISTLQIDSDSPESLGCLSSCCTSNPYLPKMCLQQNSTWLLLARVVKRNASTALHSLRQQELDCTNQQSTLTHHQSFLLRDSFNESLKSVSDYCGRQETNRGANEMSISRILFTWNKNLASFLELLLLSPIQPEAPERIKELLPWCERIPKRLVYHCNDCVFEKVEGERVVRDTQQSVQTKVWPK